ncbi:LRR domain containing protein, partial [Parasponia andersonii]
SSSLRKNYFHGSIPSGFGSLVYLQVLDLSHNHLSGSLSSALFDHPSLQQVTLSHNQFSSLELDKNMGGNSKLIALDLSYNELRGLLPAFMASMPMPALSALSLEHNKLRG